MDGEIVFQGKSKSGREIYFRYPKQGDAEEMMRHLNEVSEEQTFILWQGDKMTLEKEQSYLDDLLKKVAEKKAAPILAFSGETLLGWGDIEQSRLAEKHVGDLHIAIQKIYRGEGIGRMLLQTILEEARKNIQELRVVRLGVFANNSIAMELYKSLGFVEYGNLPKGLLHKGEYVNHIYMYKNINQ